MKIPVFPLNGAVLFPNTSIPLNIFENRYLEMVDYALANGRLIGMIQSDKNKQFYQIGCIGKIYNFNETDDGRYLISLQGMSCFKVVKHVELDLNFKILEIQKIDNLLENTYNFKKDQKENLLTKYNNYIKSKEINIDISELNKIELPQLLKFITMVSPFEDAEKQALLETLEINEFYEKLLSILDIETIGQLDKKDLN